MILEAIVASIFAGQVEYSFFLKAALVSWVKSTNNDAALNDVSESPALESISQLLPLSNQPQQSSHLYSRSRGGFT